MINDKLQGSVATYLRCDGLINKLIRKGLLQSLSVNFFNRRIFGKVTSKNVVVSYAFFVFQQCGAQNARGNHVLACNFAKYSPFEKFADKLSKRPFLI